MLFGTGVEETVRATGDQSRLNAAIDAAAITSDGTKYAPALRMAQGTAVAPNSQERGISSATSRNRLGASGRDPLPEGAELKAAGGRARDHEPRGDVRQFQRTAFSGEERVMVTAALVNRSADPVKNLPVKLEIDGRLIDTRTVNINSNSPARRRSRRSPWRRRCAPPSAGSDAGARQRVQLRVDAEPAGSVLVIQAGGR